MTSACRRVPDSDDLVRSRRRHFALRAERDTVDAWLVLAVGEQQLSLGGVPHPYGPLVSSARETGTVWTECEINDGTDESLFCLVASEYAHLATCGRVP